MSRLKPPTNPGDEILCPFYEISDRTDIPAESAFKKCLTSLQNVVPLPAELGVDRGADLLRDPRHRGGPLLPSRARGGVHNHDRQGESLHLSPS